MGTNGSRNAPWESYAGPNLAYIYEQYERYVQDPESVDATFKQLFDEWGPPPSVNVAEQPAEGTLIQDPRASLNVLQKVVAAHKLVWNIRTYGHLAAELDPLELREKSDTHILDPASYKLTQSDLSQIPASAVWENAQDNNLSAWDAIQRLYQIYTKTTAYEFSHVHAEEEREWLNSQVEAHAAPAALTAEERRSILKRLIEVEQFEHFLHRTFVGQKRFSIEGLDMLVPMIDEIVHRFAHTGAQNILMGMAHRGRLNVLAHVLGKPYEKIFSEFHHSPNKELVPSEGSIGINHGWTGDVKYHLGAYRAVKEGESVQTRITLANNPSHLEFVNPVVEGFTRAAQDDRGQPGYPQQDVTKAIAVLVHGDAAFPGEGVVAETLNFNNLPGYRNGGTLHIIANNRLGFTTESKEDRSTHYASDLAKGFEIPIVHVNADDPDACINAIRLASEYRVRFNKDFLIDLVGYRRYGHNESDDPAATQPLVYAKVRNRPTVSVLYAEKLKQEGIIDDQQIAEMRQGIQQVLKEAYDHVTGKEASDSSDDSVSKVTGPAGVITTAVPIERIRQINGELLQFPEGFRVYPKLRRILERRANALEDGGKVDWALAETLAFATILADGRPIRITGQDTERGTFAHRHLVLHDAETGETYSPLHRLSQARASFAIHNSPLSEASVLGFEYGYNVFSPDTLVIWEAQFGDFVNVAQPIIDQFIAAGRMKWSQKSSLVMLLPHGYEGQGPEHSSARLERFLQGAAEGNWTVVNVTSAAQYFHLLRRQAALAGTENACPLIVMSPKSLIRNPLVASPGSALSEGAFQAVLPQTGLGGQPDQVERLILCSGKAAIDLEEAIADKTEFNWLHVVRVEQLYPFPQTELQDVFRQFANLKEVIWLQEEPTNMGAWTYVQQLLPSIMPAKTVLRYIGRPDRSSPASGYQDVHSYEQQLIVSEALKQTT